MVIDRYALTPPAPSFRFTTVERDDVQAVVSATLQAARCSLTGWETVISPLVMIVAVGFSGAVGVFFGYYPARKAAALNPIDALRYE